jgi:hypothetical protein
MIFGVPFENGANLLRVIDDDKSRYPPGKEKRLEVGFDSTISDL